MTREQHLRDVLLQEDDEYQRLAEQHEALETQLCELLDHPHPTDTDELEKVTLKKKKLQVKDQMEQILRRHLETAVNGNAPTVGG